MRKKDTHIQTTSKSIALCDSIATIIQATLLTLITTFFQSKVWLMILGALVSVFLFVLYLNSFRETIIRHLIHPGGIEVTQCLYADSLNGFRNTIIPHINSLPQLTAESQGFEQYAALLQWSNCSEYVNSHFLLFDNSLSKDVVCNERVVEFEKREIYGAEVYLASKRLHETLAQYKEFLSSDFKNVTCVLGALFQKACDQDKKIEIIMRLTTPDCAK